MLNQTHSPEFIAIREDAEVAAGPRKSLRTRAKGYLELYRASGGVCRFALVAAHGAMWASWYLVCAKLAAMVFAAVDVSTGLDPRPRYRHFADYVDVLKEINRLVMVETYLLVHAVRRLGLEAAIAEGLSADLVRDYTRLMNEGPEDAAALRDLYHRHFLMEQDRVVTTMLDDAFAAFDWPFMRGLCQRPWVWFSYFRIGKSMNFREFTDKDERVEKGLLAYDRAAAHGFEALAGRLERRL